MPTTTNNPFLQPDWDGRRLSAIAAVGVAIGFRLDGSHFCTAVAAADGTACLDLPFSPSGHSRLQVQISVGAERDNPVAAKFGIEMGQPGVVAANGPFSLLRDLGAAEQLVAPGAEPMQRQVAIVVPVYNAPEDVERCLDSVLAHSTGASRLIVIDDASTDPAIAPLLARYRGIAGVTVLANERNLGFTATVNRGIALSESADVLLLNADTEVAAHWLTGLRRALHCAEDIATVTAVSDNAGAFSVPELEQENPLPAGWTFADAARALWQGAAHVYPQLPTGNGFCMLIRREVIEAIGAFDVEAFPQGYGEENDFCQRACAAGYRHLIAGNVLVRHARSRSFGHERRLTLGRAGMQVLRERWPNYEDDVGRTLFSFERRVLDWRARRLYADAASGQPLIRVLVCGADTERHARAGYDCILLNTSGDRFMLASNANPHIALSGAINATAVSELLQRHAIERVELGGGADPLVDVLLRDQAGRLGIPISDDGDTDLPTQDISPGFAGVAP